MRKSEMSSKHECRNTERDTHHMIPGVSILGFRELEVSRKLTTRMMKSRNAKPRCFKVLDTRSWRSQGSKSRQELTICEITKRSGPSNHQDSGPLIWLNFGVLDTGSWRSQESRLFIIGVSKLRNVKRWNPKIGTSTKTPFRSFTYREINDQRNFNLWSSEPRNPKTDTIKAC